MILELFNYGRGKSPQPNSMAVRFSWLTLYYSYKTVVGISVSWRGKSRLILSRTYWNQTTGKHLHWIRSHFSEKGLSNIEWDVESDRFDNILHKITSLLPSMDEQLCDEILAIMGDKDAQRKDGVIT